MEKVYIHEKMVESMREIMKIIRNKVMGFILGQMETFIKVNEIMIH